MEPGMGKEDRARSIDGVEKLFVEGLEGELRPEQVVEENRNRRR